MLEVSQNHNVTEKENWAIKRVGVNIKQNINKEFPDLVSISSTLKSFKIKLFISFHIICGYQNISIYLKKINILFFTESK